MALLACYPLGSGFCPLFHFLPALPCSHAMEPKLLVFCTETILSQAPMLWSFGFFCLTECLAQEGLSEEKLVLLIVNDKTMSKRFSREEKHLSDCRG